MPRRARILRFPGSPHPEKPGGNGFVEVRRCRGQAEALVVKSLLESEGIRVILKSNLAPSVHPFSVGHQGEVTLLAHHSEAERARLILRHTRPRLRLVTGG